MPQTEVLIHIVLDGEHALDYDAQSAIHGAAVSATVQAIGGGATINRNSVEVRPVADETPAEAADVAAEESAPGLDVGGGEQTAAPVPGPPDPPAGAGEHMVG